MSKTMIDPIFEDLGLDATGKPTTKAATEAMDSEKRPSLTDDVGSPEDTSQASAQNLAEAIDDVSQKPADEFQAEERPELPTESPEWQLFIESLSGEVEISDTMRRQMKIDADILATIKLCKSKKTTMKVIVNAMLRAFIISHKEDFIRLRSINNPGAAPIF